MPTTNADQIKCRSARFCRAKQESGGVTETTPQMWLRKKTLPNDHEVKALSPHHRFVIALHSPDRFDETGPGVCRPEKNGRRADCGVRRATFSSAVWRQDLRNCGNFSQFWRECSRVSLQPRLCGGEGGIRTLGTGISQYNGLANRRIRPLCHLSD